MFGALMDLINEYRDFIKKSNRWIGNDRYQEMEYEFKKLIDDMVDARVNKILAEKGLVK